METITLRINESISDKFQWFLSHFSNSEVEVIRSIDVTKLSKDDFDYISEAEMNALKKISTDYKNGNKDEFEEYLIWCID